jgi:S-DNA-T family DNA segregation ATPase FtsK/SpoIIIE
VVRPPPVGFDDWQSRWGSIAALRAVAEVVFDACSPADLRVLTRSRELPPPIERDQVWRLATEGGIDRAVLPA